MEPTLYFSFDSQDGRSGKLSLSGAFGYVGREAGVADLLINSATISRQHGAIRNIHGRWLYCDLGSTNGSWCNGKALEPDHWIFLTPHDELQLADWRLVVLPSSFEGITDVASPLFAILKADSYYAEQSLHELSGSKLIVQKIDDKLSLSDSASEKSLCSFAEANGGVNMSLMPGGSLELSDFMSGDHEKLIGSDTILQCGDSSLAVLLPDGFPKVDQLATKSDIVDPTVAIELETLDLSATATMSKKVFDQLKSSKSSSVQEFQTRRTSGILGRGDDDETFWSNFEGKLVIALAVLLLFLIALIVLTWLLNPL